MMLSCWLALAGHFAVLSGPAQDPREGNPMILQVIPSEMTSIHRILSKCCVSSRVFSRVADVPHASTCFSRAIGHAEGTKNKILSQWTHQLRSNDTQHASPPTSQRDLMHTHRWWFAWSWYAPPNLQSSTMMVYAPPEPIPLAFGH
jgi:hypothetical protein